MFAKTHLERRALFMELSRLGKLLVGKTVGRTPRVRVALLGKRDVVQALLEHDLVK